MSRAAPSRDWSTYPIMRFASVPERVEAHVIDGPSAPFLGTGEATQGSTAAAIANAVADATGMRLRELPLTQGRVKAPLAPEHCRATTLTRLGRRNTVLDRAQGLTP